MSCQVAGRWRRNRSHQGKEKKWVLTVSGKAWFPYFRLYSPKKAFLDRTWVLPDIGKVK